MLAPYINQLSASSRANIYSPTCRVVEILKEDDNNYTVMVQLINKNITFRTSPEEILVDDKLTDCFSPCDVRTLTYLGYLGIKSPKYKILAQRLSETNDHSLFAIKKKGDDHVVLKKANEILKNKEIIDHLAAEDAKLVGFSAASETNIDEQWQKEQLLKQR